MANQLNDNENQASEVESLLGRLNQMDVRLRQLEESYFTTDVEARCKTLPSTIDGIHLKDTLMDRLHMLEARIRQLSHELDKGSVSSCHGSGGGGGGGCSSSNTMMAKQVNNEGVAVSSPTEEHRQLLSNNSSKACRGPWRARADFFQSHGSKKKAGDTIQAATTEAIEKKARAFCSNDQRKVEHARLYRRWFPVGC